MMVSSIEDSLSIIVPHIVIKVAKTQNFETSSCHIVIVKIQDLSTCPTINQAKVILNVVVVHNEDGVFQLQRH